MKDHINSVILKLPNMEVREVLEVAGWRSLINYLGVTIYCYLININVGRHMTGAMSSKCRKKINVKLKCIEEKSFKNKGQEQPTRYFQANKLREITVI